MKSALTVERLADLEGVEVRSVAGEKIGHVNELFCDEATHEPEWIGVGTGFLGLKEVVVPVEGAALEGDALFVPYERDVVKRQPGFDEEDGVLTPDSERRLYLYFGLAGHPIEPHRLTRYDLLRREGI